MSSDDRFCAYHRATTRSLRWRYKAQTQQALAWFQSRLSDSSSIKEWMSFYAWMCTVRELRRTFAVKHIHPECQDEGHRWFDQQLQVLQDKAHNSLKVLFENQKQQQQRTSTELAPNVVSTVPEVTEPTAKPSKTQLKNARLRAKTKALKLERELDEFLRVSQHSASEQVQVHIRDAASALPRLCSRTLFQFFPADTWLRGVRWKESVGVDIANTAVFVLQVTKSDCDVFMQLYRIIVASLVHSADKEILQDIVHQDHLHALLTPETRRLVLEKASGIADDTHRALLQQLATSSDTPTLFDAACQIHWQLFPASAFAVCLMLVETRLFQFGTTQIHQADVFAWIDIAPAIRVIARSHSEDGIDSLAQQVMSARQLPVSERRGYDKNVILAYAIYLQFFSAASHQGRRGSLW
jgi:hypothetical protein